MNDEKTVWGVHAGIGGEADDTFLKNNVIAMGWSEVPDVATLLEAKEGIKQAIRAAKPKATTNSVANLAGQLYRFFTEVQPGVLDTIHIDDVLNGRRKCHVPTSRKERSTRLGRS
jgi:predicted Mrr-cat superfamily restriction endonuclease